MSCLFHNRALKIDVVRVGKKRSHTKPHWKRATSKQTIESRQFVVNCSYLQWIMDSHRECSVNTLPELWFVTTNIDMTHHRLAWGKDTILYA